MKKEITLYEYLYLGGKLENVDWGNAYTSYSDINKGRKIISCKSTGKKHIFKITFDNGVTEKYDSSYVLLIVELTLAQKHTQLNEDKETGLHQPIVIKDALLAEIRDEMDSDMEDSGMAQGEIESCLNHWSNKYLIFRKEWFSKF
jgi:hypothetical protein